MSVGSGGSARVGDTVLVPGDVATIERGRVRVEHDQHGRRRAGLHALGNPAAGPDPGPRPGPRRRRHGPRRPRPGPPTPPGRPGADPDAVAHAHADAPACRARPAADRSPADVSDAHPAADRDPGADRRLADGHAAGRRPAAASDHRGDLPGRREVDPDARREDVRPAWSPSRVVDALRDRCTRARASSASSHDRP